MLSCPNVAALALLLSALLPPNCVAGASPQRAPVAPLHTNEKMETFGRNLRRRSSQRSQEDVTAHEGRDLINNGDDASHNEYPPFSMMAWKGVSHGCGGSLIASKFVLTAAHCLETDFRRALPPEEREFYPEWHISRYCKQDDNCGADPFQVRSSRRIIVHPSFNDIHMWDFALVELDGESDAPVMPIDDGSYSSTLQEGDALRGIGVGQTTDDVSSQSIILKEVDNMFLPTERCRLFFVTGPQFDESVLCSNGENRGQCSGDSGSPVLMPSRESGGYPYVQVGVVSQGSPYCEHHDYPDISARVSAVHQWIIDNVCPAYYSDESRRPTYCPPPPEDFSITAGTTPAETGDSVDEATSGDDSKDEEEEDKDSDDGGREDTVDCSSRVVEIAFRVNKKKKSKLRACRIIKNNKRKKKYCNDAKSDALTRCPFKCGVCN